MEKDRTDERLQVALGQIVASNAVLAALCSTHPDPQALLASLREFGDLNMSALRQMEQLHPDRGQTMQETYLQQMAGFRQLLNPG